MARRRDRSAPADQVPGYRDVAEIGSGAFATVYRATEVDTGRHVALKVLKVDTIHPHLVETFQQEIQTLAKVSDHPNIVTLYRPVTTADGRPVLVLELCKESLAERIRRGGPLAARDMIRIGIKVAGALETAHRAGFLHRDMKPQNIMVTQFGEPALGDFGVATLQASAQATAGVFGFTTLHAAPEILEGNHLSAATDVYGLASTMYQALAGVAPFATFENEAHASVILRIIRDPVRPLRSHEIPLDLSDLLEAALAKEPASRPSSAAAFAEAMIAIEKSNGWPTTSFVAWGEPLGEHNGEEPGPRPRPEAAPTPVSPPVPASGPGSAPQLHPSAPSVRVADVAHARPTAPPATVAPPHPTVPVAAPEPVVAEPVVAEPVVAQPPDQGVPVPAVPAASSPTAAEWTLPPPPPPPPPPRRRGPGVAAPSGLPRNVVVPSPAGRGQRGPGGPRREEALDPLPEGPITSARPSFADPPSPPGPSQGALPAPSRPAPVGDSPYEQTIAPPARLRPAPRPGQTSPAARTGTERARLAWMAVIGVAAVVVLLAILLVAGVI